jgi:hypothetical protein
MNVVSVSWPDHLSFGEGDGRLDEPAKVARRMSCWRDELGARLLHWRLLRTRIPGRFSAARGYTHPSLSAARSITWDDFNIVPALAHSLGMEAWLYVSVFDEGWPLARPRQRATSYHNDMHGQHVAWQSDLTRRHPEWLTVDRSGRTRQYGVVSLAYPDARRAFVERWIALIRATRFDGLFLCLRSQSRPADHGDQFGFNEPARNDFRAKYGVDVTSTAFDIQQWRDHLGEYLTALLVEVHAALAVEGRRLAVGAARGDVLGPPLGNAALHWRTWVKQHLIDHLVIDQNSSQCPSMWHQLWPMHRGIGYEQNHLKEPGISGLAAHVHRTYEPVLKGSHTKLFLARQWHKRSVVDERRLLATDGVSGLVFSSFRHDNPRAIRRGDWRAGR